MRRFNLPLVILGCVALAAILTWIVVSNVHFGGRAPRSESAPREAIDAAEPLPPFTRLEVAGTAEVTLVQGSEESVSLPPASRKGGYVSAEVRNGTLYIEAVDRSHWWDIVIGGSNRPAPVVVAFRKLDAISAAGTVRLTAAAFQTDELKITGAGGTMIRIDDLAAHRLRVTGAGALRADVAGRVDEQEVTISGAGEFRGGKLVSRDATVNVAGAGKVLVNVEQALNATISGAGSVEYVGDPKVTQRVSGVGRVKRRESAALQFAHEAA